MRLTSMLGGLLLLTGALCAAQDTNFAAGPQYLITTDSTMFLRSISTPSISLGEALPLQPAVEESATTVEAPTYSVNPALEHQADLFPIYYGSPRVSVVELSAPEETTPPASLTGVANVFTTADSLQQLGYGIPLGDAASYWKAHKTAPRSFTNTDIQRVHPN